MIFFLLITCETCINRGFGQTYDLPSSPWIQEINLPSPYREIPNQTFFRDPHGILFIGKVNGLNIIDGGQVYYLYMEGPVHVTGNSSDTLFYASKNDFGFLIREESGAFRTVSRLELLPPSKRTFTPLGVEERPDHVIIFTDSGDLQFSGSQVNFRDRTGEPPEKTTSDSVFQWNSAQLIINRTGITADEIRQIVQWKNEIWILGSHTLHQFYHPSPLSTLEIENDLTGRILTSRVLRDRILLGTGHGIFLISRDRSAGDRWTMLDLLPETRQSVHLLSSFDNQVYAAGSHGVYEIRNDRAELIDEGEFSGILAFREGNLLASDQGGIIHYKLGSRGWEAFVLSAGLAYANSFTSYDNKVFFLCNNSVYRINYNADKIIPVPFHSDEHLHKLQQVGSSLLLIGDRQVYRYDTGEEVFHPLSQNHLSELILKSDRVVPAGSDKWWVLENSSTYHPGVYLADRLDESPDNMWFPVLQQLGEISDIAYADSLLFLTGKDRVSIFDLSLLEDEPVEISIAVNEREIPGHEQGFRISGLELQRNPLPLFRYRIEDPDTPWSEWNSMRAYSTAGLRHGKYSIQAQALDLFGRISEARQVPLTIPPPFYLSWYAYLVYGILIVLLLILFQKWRLLNFRRAETRIAERMEYRIRNLAAEKEKSDRLVSEMLPEDTVNQIISKGKARWKKYERATVLFSDIQGFTKIAEEMNPEKLIDELDSFFFHFDSVVEKYNIEKIKTIGDAYMAAGGIPQKNSTNPVEVVMAALEMQAYMQQLKSNRADIWDLRIGIHTGPVIAGVVGHKKISYDIWGDTVNTASRMESSGAAGKINISGITYGMVKDYFLCEYRGKLPVKYKGNIDMYFVNGLRPELAIDLKGMPNKRFYMQLQLLRLGDLEEKVFDDILNKLPESLYFHRPEYARKVYDQTFLLCRSEEIEEEGRLLARTAALMLFTGLSQNYHNFENRSAVICRDILPDFSYSETQIDQICNLILATKKPFDPKNRLEQILIDARMEYIGRPDFTRQIMLLYKEMKETGSKINGQQFKKQQQELLYEFDFYTTAAKRLREVTGSDQMTTLEQQRWI